MALIRTTMRIKMREILRMPVMSPESLKCLFHISSPPPTEAASFHALLWRGISYHPSLSAAVSKEVGSGGRKKAPARSMPKVQEFLLPSNESSQAAGTENSPKISLDHVIVSFARSGGSAGPNPNANKVNSKFDMRFNVKKADWLSDRVKQRILQMERNRINKDGELTISSTRTRTQKGNVEDAVAKLQVFTRLLKKFQEIIDAASYVPPPPSEDTLEKITKLSAAKGQKHLGLSW